MVPDEIRTTLRYGLQNVSQVLNRLANFVAVAAECRPSAVLGRPGRQNTTKAVASFAHRLRTSHSSISWKEIYAEWKRQQPNDKKVSKDAEGVREAYRRHYGDKSRVDKANFQSETRASLAQ